MVQPPRTSTPTEILAGLVDRVTFHNSENGFCVLRIKARGQRDLITVIGHAAMISAGEFVQASGSWINDRTHGVQFKASFLNATHHTAEDKAALARAPSYAGEILRQRGSLAEESVAVRQGVRRSKRKR
jgi:hypothetical protein